LNDLIIERVILFANIKVQKSYPFSKGMVYRLRVYLPILLMMADSQ